MKTKILFYTLAFAVAVGFSQSISAAEHHSRELSDAVFAKKAAAGGLTEVELGKLAQQKGESQDVKDFGAKMVTDHSKINDNLKAIATKDNLTIPDKPNAGQRELIDQLSKDTGKAFDTAYIHAMVKAHVGDKALFTEESGNAKNPDLKQFANDSLQVITEHLTMIEGIADTHGIAGAHHGPASATMSKGSTMAPAVTSGVAPGAASGSPVPPPQ